MVAGNPAIAATRRQPFSLTPFGAGARLPAMILIHAADLHLGKTLHERELGEEQEEMLEALVALLAERRPAALLLAGDIYDRAIPSPAAIGLLDRFLSRAVEAAPETAIVIIPGNHDSASRLAFGSGLFRKAGVHVFARLTDTLEPLVLGAREGGGGGLGSGDSPESCAIWALPFLGGAGAGEGNDSPRGQAALFAAAVEDIGKKMLARRSEAEAKGSSADSYNVLLAHCFARGGATSESERAFIGLAEEVDAALFDAFDYAALGHLHRPQAAGAKGRYSGAPLAYSFGEALRVGPSGSDGGVGVERGFVQVELGRDGARAELIPHRPRRRLVRIEASFEKLCDSSAFGEYREDLVEAYLTDPLPVLDPTERLKSAFPNLLSVRQAAFEARLPGGGTEPTATLDTGVDPEDPRRLLGDFAAFHREMKGEEPDEATTLLFRSIAEEASHAAD